MARSKNFHVALADRGEWVGWVDEFLQECGGHGVLIDGEKYTRAVVDVRYNSAVVVVLGLRKGWMRASCW